MEYIAHIRESGEIQTVEEHSLNTAALAEKYGQAAGFESFGKLLGTIHDIGKLCGDFSTYIKGGSKFARGDIDHSYAGAKYIFELAQKLGGINYTAELAARIIISHHGLHDWLDKNGGDYLEYRREKDERYDEISAAANALFKNKNLSELLITANNEITAVNQKISSAVKEALPAGGGIAKRQMGFYLGLSERLLESILVDADRTDTSCFMCGKDNSLHYDVKELWDSMHDAMEAKCAEFALRTDKISIRRSSISERCAEFAQHDVGACRLIVPTGGGKTLSSLRFAIEYCRRRELDRIVYVAPFMSILEQNGNVIKELMGEKYKELYLEHHSDMIRQLSDDEEELSKYELRAEKWDSPVIATTLVQFLNTLFSGKMSCVRRMHCLCRSVIIIDEVQAIPPKCVDLFSMAVNFLTRICGSTVVLCSATQPLFEKNEYPLLLDKQDKMTGDYTEDFIAFRRTRLNDCTKIGGYTCEEAAEFCFGKYLEAGNLLAVANTKACALELYKHIKERNDNSDCPAEVFHLSTGMCPRHRCDIIDKIKAALDDKKPIICVTTQLIEAGVDISFACVVRSLAGLDNAAQAAGRCNRNGEYNECRDVYIINISEENLKFLSEISAAQKISKSIINCGKYDDLLSVETMSQYFVKLYSEHKDKLSYPTFDCGSGTDLIDMLSVSSARNGNGKQKFYQSFAEAGKIFKIIDDNTTTVVVPYDDEANKLIEDICGAASDADYSVLLRKAQGYSVNVYETILERLNENGAVFLSESGFYILSNGYYSPEFGISSDKIGADLLFY